MRLLGVGLAFLLAGLTYADGARWQSDQTLWCDAARVATDRPRALNNCALEYLRAGQYAQAAPLLAHAAARLEHREPNRRAAWRSIVRSNQVLVLYALRRTDEMTAAIRAMDPTDPRAEEYRRWIAPSP